MTDAVVPQPSRGGSSKKPASGSPSPSLKAAAAFQRTLESRQELSLNGNQPSGAAREGVSRLRGAFVIELNKIRPDPNQPRKEFNADELANLANSIRERGVRQPIRVWFVAGEGVYQIVSGERRYRAALAAGIPSLPCIVDDAPEASPIPPRREVLVDQIVENWQREDLNPYDLSDALKELRDAHGLSQEEIGRLTGKPKSEISRFLAMQRVVPDIQQKIRQDNSGRFSRRHVVALSNLPPKEQRLLVERIKTERLTAQQTERLAKQGKRRAEGKADRGARITQRRFAVGATTVRITFRKANVSTADVLHVLDRVRGMVEQEIRD